MQFGDLLSALSAVRRPTSGLSLPISDIVCDSRRARVGSLFVCLRGAQEDGHAYFADAYARGCRAFLCEHPISGVWEGACVAYVPDAQLALATLAAAFYGHPARHLFLIALTGTKGKTTTAALLVHLLSEAGVPMGYIGSGGIRFGGVERRTENTTPDPLVLHAALADMLRAGVRAVAVEVSSQAISAHRVAGLRFPICVFTNLAADHIGAGEHPDFAHYRDAKARLFSDYGCECAIVNLDDESTPYLLARASATRVLGVSQRERGADLFANKIRPLRRPQGFATSFCLHEKKALSLPVTLSLPGECNVQNACLALAAARAYFEANGESADIRSLARSLDGARVDGRFTLVPTLLAEVDFVIDYAHNGYSLAAALATLRAYSPARLVCLFGSVGGRTYSRRSELARPASAADFCIVTADNPDGEDPLDTMRELCRILDEQGCPYIALPDRATAIRFAVRHACAGDLVLLAGKGHEDYQIIDGERVPFSEREILGEEAARLAPCPAWLLK